MYMIIPSIANNNISVNTTSGQIQLISNITHELAIGNISTPPGAINRSNETPIYTPMPQEPPYRPSPSFILSIIFEVIIFAGIALYINKKK